MDFSTTSTKTASEQDWRRLLRWTWPVGFAAPPSQTAGGTAPGPGFVIPLAGFANRDIATRQTSSQTRRAGLTLIETLVASSIGSLVAAGLAALVMYSNRSFAAMMNYVDLDHKSRIALDSLSREIRQANQLTSFSDNQLTFEDADCGVLSFVYDADAGTLTRLKNGQPDARPLLKECEFLKFAIFQRNPVGGTYNQYPTALADTCKLVQLHWICSRRIFGVKVNTESVQSAKIVIRRQ